MTFPKRLIDGYNAFAAGRLQKEQDRYRDLAEAGQAPQIMVIGCCDSRVSPEVVFDAGPGELFVVRNVANIVVHSDLNALSAIQFAVERLKVRDIMVVGHYGCSGVQAALEAARIGLADNWIRHVQDVRHRHRQLLDSLPEEMRANALCDINVIEQVVNVSVSTVMVDAWARGQKVAVHGWTFGVHDGLLQDLQMTVSSPDQLDALYRKAIDRVWDVWNALRQKD